MLAKRDRAKAAEWTAGDPGGLTPVPHTRVLTQFRIPASAAKMPPHAASDCQKLI